MCLDCDRCAKNENASSLTLRDSEESCVSTAHVTHGSVEPTKISVQYVDLPVNVSFAFCCCDRSPVELTDHF